MRSISLLLMNNVKLLNKSTYMRRCYIFYLISSTIKKKKHLDIGVLVFFDLIALEICLGLR